MNKTQLDKTLNTVKNYVDKKDYITYRDTRTVNEGPGEVQQGLSVHLKSSGKDGLSDGGSYHPSIHIKPWNDYSGGPYGELALTQNQNLWFRTSSSNTAWNAWKKVSLDGHTHSTYLPLAGGTMTGGIKAGSLTNTWVDAAKNSKAMLVSTAAAGSFSPMMTAKTTNGSMVLGVYQANVQLNYYTKANVDAGTNTSASSATLMNESGGASWTGTVSAPTFSENGTTLANKYAPKSHGTHVSYGGNGSATTVSRSDHTHSYLPLSGGTITGNLTMGKNNTYIYGKNTSGTAVPMLRLTSSNVTDVGNTSGTTCLLGNSNPTFYNGSTTYTLYHTGNKPTPTDIGAAAKSHTHKSLELSGNNTISLADDTTTKWGAQKNSIHYYSTTGKLTNQPGQYGILCNFTNGDKEVHQLWLTQNHGNILHRGGNAEGWNTASWLTLLDTGNYSNYAFPKTGGTLTGKITFQDQLGGGGLSSLINCNALHSGTGNGQLITASGNHIYVGNPKTPITIEGNTHPKVNVNGTEYTMYHTGNKPSPSDIGASESGHVHHQVATLGNVAAETGANHPNQPGLSMRHVYNNGYPVPYGNVITLRGAGSNQILTEWSGSDAGAGRLYIRNKRDTSGDWSGWAQVYTSTHKPSASDIGAAPSNHTHTLFTRGSIGDIGWDAESNRGLPVAVSAIAFWNGAYSGASSNLAYCNQGAFGSIVTKNTGDYAAASHTHGLTHSDLGITIANTTSDSGWSMISSSYNGYILRSIRAQQDAPAWHLGNYSAGVCFGGADTKGVISCSYDHAETRFAGGNGSKPVWWFGLQGKSGTTYNLDSFNAAKWGGYTVRTGSGLSGASGSITFSW